MALRTHGPCRRRYDDCRPGHRVRVDAAVVPGAPAIVNGARVRDQDGMLVELIEHEPGQTREPDRPLDSRPGDLRPVHELQMPQPWAAGTRASVRQRVWAGDRWPTSSGRLLVSRSRPRSTEFSYRASPSLIERGDSRKHGSGYAWPRRRAVGRSRVKNTAPRREAGRRLLDSSRGWVELGLARPAGVRVDDLFGINRPDGHTRGARRSGRLIVLRGQQPSSAGS